MKTSSCWWTAPVRWAGAVALLLLLGNGQLSAQDSTQNQRVPTAADLQIPAGLTPAQAQALLQQRPDLAQQLRERISASGLTPDQIRARLRAAGYPENMLDDYLAGADTTKQVAPGSGVLEAARLLGIVSAEEVDSLRTLTDSAMAIADSLRKDSLSVKTRGLQVFGLDVFRRQSKEFAPAFAGPIEIGRAHV